MSLVALNTPNGFLLPVSHPVRQLSVISQYSDAHILHTVLAVLQEILFSCIVSFVMFMCIVYINSKHVVITQVNKNY